MKKAVFLDRDGVLNYPLEEKGGRFELLPGVDEACRSLSDAGFELVVVTNQPDIARGKIAADEVERMNAVVRQALPVRAVLTCPHDDVDACPCRKPKPGMILDAARRWDLDPKASYMVGDRSKDVEAGQAAGCRTLLIDRGTGQAARCKPDWIAPHLPRAAEIIVMQGAF